MLIYYADRVSLSRPEVQFSDGQKFKLKRPTWWTFSLPEDNKSSGPGSVWQRKTLETLTGNNVPPL